MKGPIGPMLDRISWGGRHGMTMFRSVRDMIWCPYCGKRWDGHGTACEPKQPEAPKVETLP